MKKRINIVLLTILLVLIALFATYIYIQNSRVHVMPSVGEICEMLDGIRVEEYNECEGDVAERCKLQDGTFDECASACRHDPDAICTMQCVPVCKLD